MGRLIDCNDVYNAIQITTDNFGVAKKVVEDNMLTMLSKIETVEAIPKDQYENRLKADLEAILVELQLEIEKIKIDLPFGFEPVSKTAAFYEGVSASSGLIQQKINALQGDQERDNG